MQHEGGGVDFRKQRCDVGFTRPFDERQVVLLRRALLEDVNVCSDLARVEPALALSDGLQEELPIALGEIDQGGSFCRLVSLGAIHEARPENEAGDAVRILDGVAHRAVTEAYWGENKEAFQRKV